MSENAALDLMECKPCVICGSDRTTPFYSFPPLYYDHNRFETASWDGRRAIPLHVVQCADCGLAYSRPSFRQEALHLIYPEDLVPASMTFEDALKASTPKHTAQLARVRRYFEAGTICDVGCRYGVFPYLASRAGYQAFGIEYNPASVRIANAAGSRVFQGTVDDIRAILPNVPCSHVDAFVLDDVIEHFVNPRQALETLCQVQKPKGLLFLSQMDLDSLGHRVFRKRWYYLQPGAHMYYFNKRSLSRLLDVAGYRVIDVVRPGLTTQLDKFTRGVLRRLNPLRKRHSVPGQGGPTGKPMYLTRRFRSLDDIFFVVAEKR